jgi:hypothetical protein
VPWPALGSALADHGLMDTWGLRRWRPSHQVLMLNGDAGQAVANRALPSASSHSDQPM